MRTGAILVCNHSSVAELPLRSIGLPVIAVSTAINAFDDYDYWAVLDLIYGNKSWTSHGEKVVEDPSVTKILIKDKRGKYDKHPIENILWHDPRDKRCRGSSLLFAIDWLIEQKCPRVYLAGCTFERMKVKVEAALADIVENGPMQWASLTDSPVCKYMERAHVLDGS